MSICTMLHQVRSSIRNLPTQFIHCAQILLFSSSSLARIDQTPNQHSFAVNYLVNSCGFPLEKAVAASKYTNFKTPEKPDSVIAFFRNHGFTKTQALNLIRKVHQLAVVCDPEKTLLPKLEFFESKGFSTTDVVKILSLSPQLLTKSLENHIIPSFEFIKNLTGSEEKALSAVKRFSGRPLLVHLESRLAPNFDILREAGVPDGKIAYALMYNPRLFMRNRERFRQNVEEVKKLGFNPRRVIFMLAVQVLNQLSKPMWEKKIEVYKKWGLSQDEILVTFTKYPFFMAVSEDKITRIMDFLVNIMDLDSSFVLKMPQLLSLSFEKRIEPRGLVYKAMQAKGLTKKPNISLRMMLSSTEMWFLQKVVNLAKEEAPALLKLYKEKMALAR